MPIIDTSKDLAALFAAQVKRTPDLVALEDETATYTYVELDDEVETLSRRLRSYGVSRDSLVGILLPRSAHYVIACLAALRAGGAFLVLELAYPPDLLADVLEDANPTVVVTHRAEVGKIKTAVPLITMGEEAEQEINGHAKEPAPLPADNDLERLA
jgi:non-ribosomal peptide synthetase component F